LNVNQLRIVNYLQDSGKNLKNVKDPVGIAEPRLSAAAPDTASGNVLTFREAEPSPASKPSGGAAGEIGGDSLFGRILSWMGESGQR
jgi:hypothetical protein